jgi:hypothetical protein
MGRAGCRKQKAAGFMQPESVAYDHAEAEVEIGYVIFANRQYFGFCRKYPNLGDNPPILLPDYEDQL